MTLVGRSEEVGRVTSTSSKILLITGDEGVGKSTVLEAAQLARPDAVTPAVVSLRHSPGALQQALLDALAGSVALLSEDESALRRIGGLVQDAAGRMAEDRLRTLGPAVGRHLLDLVRTKVSPSLADLVAEFAHNLSTSVDERLAERITAASSPDVIDVILSFAREIVGIAADRPVVLALDNLHRLDDDDLRRLRDLVQALPQGIHIVGAFTTSTASERGKADTLATEGVDLLSLNGLDEAPLRQWLVEEGLSESLAPGVHRVTNGYPFHIVNAINLLKGGDTEAALERLEPSEIAIAGTRKCWRELDPYSQQAAQQLAPFANPIDPARAAAYLNMSVPAWATLQARLIDSGLFAGAQDPWFHELRRRALWDEVLTLEQRAAAASAAFGEVHAQLALPGSTPDTYVLYARLAAQNPTFAASDPQLSAVIGASAAEVAVLAALMELAEFTRGQLAVLAEAVLTHARETFSADGDLVEELHRLAAQGLVAVSSDRNVTLVVPTWRSDEVSLLIAARSAADLGRRPVPEAATTLFNGIIRPKLGSFKGALYGVGWPRMVQLSNNGRILQSQGPNGMRIVGRQGPNILVRARYGDLPVYMTAAFESGPDRDAALGRLTTLDEPVWDGRFRTVDVMSHPTHAIPSRRFILAAEILTGRSLGNSRSTIGMQANGNAEMPIEEQIERRTALLKVMRDRSSPIERYAYGLEEPVAFLYDDREHLRAEVQGLVRSRRVPFTWSISSDRPFQRFDLIHRAGLASGERLATIHVTSHARLDPVLDELSERHQRAAAFNAEQDPVLGVLSESWLRPAIADSMVRAREDVAALTAVVPVREEVPGKTVLLLIELAQPNQTWVPGAIGAVISAEIDEDPGNIDAQISVLPSGHLPTALSFLESAQVVAGHFGVDPARIRSVGDGDALGRIAGLLGCTDHELRLQYE